MSNLDDPNRISDIHQAIMNKPALYSFYINVYRRYEECLKRCPQDGLFLELGSGGGFASKQLPGIITSDVLPYRGINICIDATRLPFLNDSLRAIVMLNTFHHICDVSSFLSEAQRCLKPEGRLLIVDQHPGIISYPILRFFHHEPFVPNASQWQFNSSGPLSGANGALAWIIFQRDLSQFQQTFPHLNLENYKPHTPLQYWLSGGLKRWNLVPHWLLSTIHSLERLLLKISRNFGSFVDIEIVKHNMK